MNYRKLTTLLPRRAPLTAAIAAATLTLGGTALAEERGQQRDTQDQPEYGASQESQSSTSERDARSSAGDSSSPQDWQSEQSTAGTETDSDQGKDAQAVAKLAENNESLETFTKALEASGLAQALSGSTQYTIFAPTNEAFENASERSIDELMKPENRQELVELLRAHIVADDVDMDMAKRISEARTIDGGSIRLSSEQDKLQVGDSSVVESSIQEGNLRVYPIDGVLESRSEFAAFERDDQGQRDGRSDSQSDSQWDDQSEDQQSTGDRWGDPDDQPNQQY